MGSLAFAVRSNGDKLTVNSRLEVNQLFFSGYGVNNQIVVLVELKMYMVFVRLERLARFLEQSK